MAGTLPQNDDRQLCYNRPRQGGAVVTRGLLGSALVIAGWASSAAAQMVVYPSSTPGTYAQQPAQEYYYEEEEILASIDFGLQVEWAFTGAGDEYSSSSSAVFGMGGALGAHIGVDLSGFVALLLVSASAHLQVAGESGRGYAGVGPAILLGWRPVLDGASRLSLELGGGLDYGVSAATQPVLGARRVEGAFPTVHGRVAVTGLDDDGLPVTAGLHLFAAVPTEAPGLFIVAGTVFVGLRTL
jgi:hypothetical protein